MTQSKTEPNQETYHMPYLTVSGGYSAKFGEAFAGLLNDDGCRSLPVQATRISEFWLKIGADDLRQITSIFAHDGRCTLCILPSRLNAAAQARNQRLREAVAAGLMLQSALSKLDPADRNRAMLDHQLGHWLKPSPQSTPIATPAD
jgi:hypothetical protein